MKKNELNTLASNVSRLSNLLTKDRGALPYLYLKDKELREAYIAYYLPPNMHKVHLPLRELALHPARIFRKKYEIPKQVRDDASGIHDYSDAPFAGDRLRILDLGSGPGTAILGVMKFFSAAKDKPFLEFTAVDPVEENLREAERLFRICKEDRGAATSLLTKKARIEGMKTLPEGPFDLIILSNVLSEISHSSTCHPELVSGSKTMPGKEIPKQVRNDRHVGLHQRFQRDFQAKLLNSLLTRNLALDGSCIIIEPALRETSRELLEVRDGLIREGLHVYSPCLINDPCPALVNPKDWCHEEIPWEPPEIIREIDKLTGLRKDSLKFSYLIVRRDTLSLRDIFTVKAFRIVSEPLKSKGKLEYYVCGPGGRRLVVRLDRDETLMNHSLSQLRRGMIVSFQGLVDDGRRLRVLKETGVLPYFQQDKSPPTPFP